tara:strand:- start:263 stop:538 length:276 start_codon:yes stop_codon:yes gene_type:complete
MVRKILGCPSAPPPPSHDTSRVKTSVISSPAINSIPPRRAKINVFNDNDNLYNVKVSHIKIISLKFYPACLEYLVILNKRTYPALNLLAEG